jgi:bifunctional DNA-binding transcriptional regulator/antitoxin component of YhaV-PrlF toxin-antitoxin module
MDDTSDSQRYGEVDIDERGRLTLPKELREELQIDGGTVFGVLQDGPNILLTRRDYDLETLRSKKSNQEWRNDAFRDAGEGTFGGR